MAKNDIQPRVCSPEKTPFISNSQLLILVHILRAKSTPSTGQCTHFTFNCQPTLNAKVINLSQLERPSLSHLSHTPLANDNTPQPHSTGTSNEFITQPVPCCATKNWEHDCSLDYAPIRHQDPTPCCSNNRASKTPKHDQPRKGTQSRNGHPSGG